MQSEQQQASKLKKIIIWVILGIAAIGIGAICFSAYVDANTYRADMLHTMEAYFQDDEQALGSYGNAAQEIAQTAGLQADLTAKIVSEANKARYGEDGSKASWAWLKEANPNLPDKVFNDLSALIQTGRIDQKDRNTRRTDICRRWKTSKDYLWTGFWLDRVEKSDDPENILKWCKVISSDYASDTYTSGKGNALNIRNQ